MRIKTTVLLSAIIILLILIIGIGSYVGYNYYKIYKQNTENFISGPSAQQTFTKKEMKQVLDSTTKSILNRLDDIKVKNVQTYTQVLYNVRDSIRITEKLISDSLKQNYSFNFDRDCFSLSGYVTPSKNTITLLNRESIDVIDIFHYRKNKRKFLFFKWDFYDVAGAWSRCAGDTLAVKKFYSRRK